MINAVGDAQSVLIVGGTSDIGLAVVTRYARGSRLERVVLAGRVGERLDAAERSVAGLGAETTTVALNNDDIAGHESSLATAFAGGDIDVVILAAAVLGDQERAEHDGDYAAAIVTTNVTGPVSIATRVVEHLRRQGHGTLVVLSSVAGERPRRSNYVYGATKAGLDAFAAGLSDALAGTGVHVLVVRPGFVRSKMTEGLKPAPFATTPEAVADAVFDGVRSGRQVVWVPGLLRWVMAALRHLPRPVFRRIPG